MVHGFILGTSCEQLVNKNKYKIFEIFGFELRLIAYDGEMNLSFY